jgi:predicted DCC family thiol-disulfide oxidoreductase YuxK
VWKTIWYDWYRHVDIPYGGMSSYHSWWAIPFSKPWILVVEKWALIGFVFLFVVGYRVRFTGIASSLLLAHLAIVRSSLVGSGETQSLFIGALIVLFFALYAETDHLSIDGIRRGSGRSVESFADRLKSTEEHSYPMPAMKYSLLLLAVLFFSTGFSKVLDGNGTGFFASDNLTRLVLIRSYVYPWHDVQLLVVEYPAVGVLGGIGTLIVEMGFIVSILLGIGFVPFVLGLFAFTMSNVLFLGIFFVDNLFFLGLFAAFDRGIARIQRDRDLVLAFDEHCLFCMRTLYPFKLLDVEDTVTFHSQYTLPDVYRNRDDVDLDRAMYVFDGADTYEGYDAFVELFGQYRIFAPLVWLMRTRPVRAAGKRIYGYIAANRGRHFTCRVPEKN